MTYEENMDDQIDIQDVVELKSMGVAPKHVYFHCHVIYLMPSILSLEILRFPHVLFKRINKTRHL